MPRPNRQNHARRLPSEQQAEQYGNRIEADNEKSLWPAYCDIAAVTPNRLSGLP